MIRNFGIPYGYGFLCQIIPGFASLVTQIVTPEHIQKHSYQVL